jgi:hypothetical protein
MASAQTVWLLTLAHLIRFYIYIVIELPGIVRTAVAGQTTGVSCVFRVIIHYLLGLLVIDSARVAMQAAHWLHITSLN